MYINNKEFLWALLCSRRIKIIYESRCCRCRHSGKIVPYSCRQCTNVTHAACKESVCFQTWLDHWPFSGFSEKDELLRALDSYPSFQSSHGQVTRLEVWKQVQLSQSEIMISLLSLVMVRKTKLCLANIISTLVYMMTTMNIEEFWWILSNKTLIVVPATLQSMVAILPHLTMTKNYPGHAGYHGLMCPYIPLTETSVQKKSPSHLAG